MEASENRTAPKAKPGTWSTDDYIRRWARSHCKAVGECIIELQSLQDRWLARIDFDQKQQPVSRILIPGDQALAA